MNLDIIVFSFSLPLEVDYIDLYFNTEGVLKIFKLLIAFLYKLKLKLFAIL